MKQVSELFKPALRMRLDSELPLVVELKSNAVVYEMIKEFGLNKTATAIQSLYDNDVLNYDQATAMLHVINDIKLSHLSINGMTGDGEESFRPVTLH